MAAPFRRPCSSSAIRCLRNALAHTPGAALIAVIALTAVARASGPPEPFRATYELHRNDRAAGEAEFSLRLEGGVWEFRSLSRGTRGMARLLGFRDEEISRGLWREQGPRPRTYSHQVRTVATRDEWSADYDWEHGQVHTRHEDGESVLPLQSGVVDPSTVALVIRAGLAEGEREWRLRVVDEDEIEEQVYRVTGTRRLDTALGCAQADVVERDRPGSSRYTRSYHAHAWDYLPVRIEHGKPDGDRYALYIQSLVLDGEAVDAGEPCD